MIWFSYWVWVTFQGRTVVKLEGGYFFAWCSSKWFPVWVFKMLMDFVWSLEVSLSSSKKHLRFFTYHPGSIIHLTFCCLRTWEGLVVYYPTVDGLDILLWPIEVGSFSHYLHRFIHLRCRISSINSNTLKWMRKDNTFLLGFRPIFRELFALGRVCYTSWWFQPNWRILVKMGIFPR